MTNRVADFVIYFLDKILARQEKASFFVGSIDMMLLLMLNTFIVYFGHNFVRGWAWLLLILLITPLTALSFVSLLLLNSEIRKRPKKAEEILYFGNWPSKTIAALLPFWVETLFITLTILIIVLLAGVALGFAAYGIYNSLFYGENITGGYSLLVTQGYASIYNISAMLMILILFTYNTLLLVDRVKTNKKLFKENYTKPFSELKQPKTDSYGEIVEVFTQETLAKEFMKVNILLKKQADCTILAQLALDDPDKTLEELYDLALYL